MSTLKNKNSVKTIEAGGQLCKNLRTMRLGQNLLVLIKKKRVFTQKSKCLELYIFQFISIPSVLILISYKAQYIHNLAHSILAG